MTTTDFKIGDLVRFKGGKVVGYVTAVREGNFSNGAVPMITVEWPPIFPGRRSVGRHTATSLERAT